MDTMTFRQWLAKQENRDDPVGDLARDVKADKRPAPRVNSYKAWSDHLHRAGASPAALRAFFAAWREYRP